VEDELLVRLVLLVALVVLVAVVVLEEVDVLVTVPVLDEETVLVVDKVKVLDVVLLDVVDVAVILVDVLEEVLVLLDVVVLLASILYRNQSVSPWLVPLKAPQVLPAMKTSPVESTATEFPSSMKSLSLVPNCSVHRTLPVLSTCITTMSLDPKLVPSMLPVVYSAG